jgi:hypothetical protein
MSADVSSSLWRFVYLSVRSLPCLITIDGPQHRLNLPGLLAWGKEPKTRRGAAPVEAMRALIAMCDYDRRPSVSLGSAMPFDAGQQAQDMVRTGSRRGDGGGDASGLWLRCDSTRRAAPTNVTRK